MDHLDDLPKRPKSHVIETKAVAAFECLLSKSEDFVLQASDRADYGTDCQIEVFDRDSATNVRLHVQLKGTEKELNADGSVSIDVRPQTLNYLLAQPHSFFACYHVPTEMLRFCAADTVIRDYEHRGVGWFEQQTVTVRFSEALTTERLRSLASLARYGATLQRNARIAQVIAGPEDIPEIVRTAQPDVHVPEDADRAVAMLQRLYESGADRAISAAFEKFASVLGSDHDGMTYVYMSEINLGMAGRRDHAERIAQGIAHLASKLDAGRQTPSSLYYSIGNGCSALGREKDAVKAYEKALGVLRKEDCPEQQAQCHKNLGASYEKLGDTGKAVAHYRVSVRLDPQLAEAHYALGTYCHRRGDHAEALDHFDQVVFVESTLGTRSSASG